MRPLKKTLLGTAICGGLFLVLNACTPIVWFLGSVHGRVVDDASGEPIPAAAVSAAWALQSLEESTVGYLALEETTTDAKGEFELSAAGPRFHFSRGRLRRTQPVVRVIAADYFPTASRSSNDTTDAVLFLAPARNGRTIRLRHANADASYEQALNDFIDYFPFVRDNHDCEWLRVPETMRQLLRGREQLIRVGRGSALPDGVQTNKAGCAADNDRGE